MIKYYAKTEHDGMIHMVGEFPAPRRDGHTQCGRSISGEKLIELKQRTVFAAGDYRFCLKCSQLIDDGRRQ